MIKATKKNQIKTNWHLIDASGLVLGRLASTITPLLIGKNKPYFVRSLDCGDHVVVINADKILVTGKKEKQKKYYHYSGYPGGLRIQSFKEAKEKYPERIITRAINNMLPKNKLRDGWMAKLHVFARATHPFADKFRDQADKPEKSKTTKTKIKSEVKEK